MYLKFNKTNTSVSFISVKLCAFESYFFSIFHLFNPLRSEFFLSVPAIWSLLEGSEIRTTLLEFYDALGLYRYFEKKRKIKVKREGENNE